MATFAGSRVQLRAFTVFLAGVSVVSLTGCAVSSPAPETGAQSVVASPSLTGVQSDTEVPFESEPGGRVEPTAPDADSGDVVNAENAYEVCLHMVETKSHGPSGVPGGYSRDKLAPESESVIYQREDGIFGVAIYGTVGDTWVSGQRDYMLICYIEGPVNDPVWYELGIQTTIDPSELPAVFEGYDIHAGA